MRKTYFITFFLGLFLYLSLPIKAQDISNSDSLKTFYLSLEDAKNYAVKHNYQNKNSELDIEIAKKKIWETTAIGLPQISGSVDYQNNLQIRTTLLPGEITGHPGTYVPVKFGQQHSLTWGIQANQLIFSGEYIVGLQASRIFLELSEKSYTKSTYAIQEAASKSYYLVLIGEESKKILKETNKNFADLLHEIEESYKLGFVEDIDVDQLRLTKQNNDNTIISINSQINLARRLLKYQLGIDYKDTLVLTDSLEYFTKNIDYNKLMNQQLELNKNIDYQLTQTQEALALLDLKREKSNYLPKLSAFYSYQQSAFNNEFKDLSSNWYPSSVLGVSISIPIFSSGMKRSRVQQKDLALLQARNSKKNLEQSLNLKFEQLNNNYNDAHLKFENEKNSMDLAKRINHKTEIKYKKGVASANDLLIVQNQYLNTLNGYYQALSSLLAAKTELEYLLIKN